MFYTIQNGGLLTAENEQALTRFYDNVKELPTGYAPNKYIVKNGELVLNEHYSDEQALEELQKEQTSLETQIAQLKDQLLTATLADDTEQVAAIKAEYQNLVGVQDYDSN